jgi:hypothetical protein
MQRNVCNLYYSSYVCYCWIFDPQMYIRRDGSVQGPLWPREIRDIVTSKFFEVCSLQCTISNTTWRLSNHSIVHGPKKLYDAVYMYIVYVGMMVQNEALHVSCPWCSYMCLSIYTMYRMASSNDHSNQMHQESWLSIVGIMIANQNMKWKLRSLIST